MKVFVKPFSEYKIVVLIPFVGRIFPLIFALIQSSSIPKGGEGEG